MGIKNGDRQLLSKAITLIESNLPEDIQIADEIIAAIIKDKYQTVRIGITGPPGVGKSSLIESFGGFLTSLGKKVAVIAVDPSSALSKGSIMGDKTRMESLAANPLAFIRPSATNEYLGGTHAKSREAIMLCEAAGYEIIIVETVGVGQSETLVRSLVDYFLLLHLAGSGDELQGIKRGILEHADSILVTKADGENIYKAQQAKKQLELALHFSENKNIAVNTYSIFDETSNKSLWLKINEFIERQIDTGFFQEKRQNQQVDWLHEIIKRKIVNNFYSSLENSRKIDSLEKAIQQNELTAFQAVEQLFKK